VSMNRVRTPGLKLSCLGPLVVGILLSAGCDSSAEVHGTVVSDSAGISISTHQGNDQPATLRFQEEFRLGGSDSRPEESFYQVGSGTVGIDSEGRIHVLNPDAHRVDIFDGRGNHLRTVGRAGGGPGELGRPFGLSVSPSGGFAVTDVSKPGFVGFGPDGEILPTVPFPPGFFGGPVHRFEGGMIVTVQERPEGSTRLEDVLLEITEDDTLRITRLQRPEMVPIELTSCGMRFSGMPPMFSPTLRWTARGDRVAAASSAEYDIGIFEDGRPVRRVRRSVEARPATERLAIEELGEGMSVGTEAGTVVCDPTEVVRKRGIAPVIPAIGRLAFAPDGSLWVERGGVRDEPRPIDVFSSDAEYRGTLPPGSPFPVAFFPDGRFAAADTDELDVTRLVVYRIVED